MKEKYPAYNPSDTKWDEHHRKTGQMTNSEFFTSSGNGGFYEGMEYDEESGEWVLGHELREEERIKEESKCKCGYFPENCWCYED